MSSTDSRIYCIFQTLTTKRRFPECPDLRLDSWSRWEEISLYLSLCSVAPSCLTLWAAVGQAPPSMGFMRQEYWRGVPFPSPEDLPDPGIEPTSPALQADSLPLSHLGSRPCIRWQLIARYRIREVDDPLRATLPLRQPDSTLNDLPESLSIFLTVCIPHKAISPFSQA